MKLARTFTAVLIGVAEYGLLGSEEQPNESSSKGKDDNRANNSERGGLP
jgi:hypothetical protein